MGAESSNNCHLDTMLVAHQKDIESNYYHTVYASHKKTPAQFQHEVNSIIKRASYLHYPWAQQLLDNLKKTPKERLYQHYKTLLKENSHLNGRDEKTFYGAQLQTTFMQNFSQKKEKMMSQPKYEDLLQLTEESKAFLMVLAWLHCLTSLQNKTEEDNKQNERQNTGSHAEETICSGLLALANKYFETSLKTHLPSHRNGLINQNRNIMVLLQKTKRKQSFFQKQMTIKSIEKELQEVPSESKAILQDICLLFGQSQVLSHILVMREMGAERLPVCWSYLRQCMKPVWPSEVKEKVFF